MIIKVTDNFGKVGEEFEKACMRALERCGQEAEGFAKDLSPPPKTGRLKNSIAHKVVAEEKTVYIGTDVEYAIYVEAGTGKYYPGGRNTPWAYQDANGDWHRTEGQKAQPYLKPAVEDHKRTYQNIIDDEMRNG